MAHAEHTKNKRALSLTQSSLVIRMGLEPMTRSLEGCCSNPTELPNHPFRLYALKCAIKHIPLQKTTAKIYTSCQLCKLERNFISLLFTIDINGRENAPPLPISLCAQAAPHSPRAGCVGTYPLVVLPLRNSPCRATADRVPGWQDCSSHRPPCAVQQRG